MLSRLHNISVLSSPLLVLVHGAVSGSDDMSLSDQSSTAPELPPPSPVKVDRRHPRHFALERLVAADDPALGNLHPTTN